MVAVVELGVVIVLDVVSLFSAVPGVAVGNSVVVDDDVDIIDVDATVSVVGTVASNVAAGIDVVCVVGVTVVAEADVVALVNAATVVAFVVIADVIAEVTRVSGVI